MKPVTIYLAGAIRDGRDEDIDWREKVIASCYDLPARFLNPLAGKHYDPESRLWTTAGGHVSDMSFITKHDKWCVTEADILLVNFKALSQSYPMIGSLVEFGMAAAQDKLIYSIIDPDYTGHENVNMYKLHPFLEAFSAAVLPTLEEAIPFIRARVEALSGFAPSYID